MEIENQRSLSTDGREAFERQILILENQKKELLKINKQWDQEFRNMKAVYEQKLKEKFTTYQHSLSDLEKELDQKQRDFDKKLLLAKAKLETAEEQKQTLNAKLLEAEEENKHLKECHSSITKQKGYYEHEIARLNKALSDAIRKQNVPCMSHGFDSTEIMRQSHPEELTTQIEVLKQQVQIFEEDFQKERCDRERMNEEKEELKKNIEHLQSKLTLLNTRLKTYEEDFIKERKEKDFLGKKLKKQATGFSQSPTTPYPPLTYAPYINYGHPYGIPVHYPAPALMMPQTESRGYQQHPMPDCPWYLQYSNQLSPDHQNGQKCRPKDITSTKRNTK
ncbi:TNFAIP3-interacting protein 1 isoform X2 [Stegostoma tigrinum]|nr:TNFAIP3-interacting protein 1 isoform X2 [Stegostoma tigrinum]XP_048395622.1 TNFAIP3-interacting protein 1 isoform X2 [Stegostoma tigrinum]XP_048395631.1 TNFAIP3-interacting protein 1 isoform X2 [Stegostoma tigrinum]XP_048395639.1 TNFAIP3-interacting protein 1 isoform X2 [Stegostoma tigrinum]